MELIRINDNEVDTILEMVDVDNAGGPVYNYQGKAFSGIIESFYDNGRLQDDAEFTDGHIGGVQRKYYENGQMKEEYYKFYGKLDKHFKAWSDKGKLLHHSIWKKGEEVKVIVPW